MRTTCGCRRHVLIFSTWPGWGCYRSQSTGCASFLAILPTYAGNVRAPISQPPCRSRRHARFAASLWRCQGLSTTRRIDSQRHFRTAIDPRHQPVVSVGTLPLREPRGQHHVRSLSRVQLDASCSSLMPAPRVQASCSWRHVCRGSHVCAACVCSMLELSCFPISVCLLHLIWS